MTKQLKRLWSLALLLILMCLPEMMWAETGNWTLLGVNYGICAVDNNKCFPAKGMGNNTSWGSYSITSRDDLGAVGCQGTEFAGTTTKSNEKFISISRYKQTYAVPSYAKLVRTSVFKVCMASARYRHGAGLYIFDTDNEAYTTSLDAMPYQDQATLSECIIKATDHDGTHTWSQNSRSITFDNSTSANDATFEKFAAFMHVTCSYDSPDTKGNEWAGFIENSYTEAWTYYATITFNANGGTGSMANQTIENSGTLTASSFSRDDYIFMGWNTKADGSGTSYADAADLAATNTNKGPITLYAQWIPTATITFDANGGSGTMNQLVIVSSGPLTANAFTRENYLFTGWNTSSDGSGTAYANKAAFTATSTNKGSVTLYAQWVPAVTTITFNANDGEGTMAQQVITGSGTLTANTFTRTNYVFKKWNTKADGTGSLYADRATFTVTYSNNGSITLYAQWTPTATITFDANGGSGTMAQQQITGSGTLTANTFTRENYLFTGWNTSSDGSGTAYAKKATFTATDSNKGPVTLYAQWEPAVITITFNANGGSGTMAQQTITGSGTLFANAFTHDDYLFAKWNTNADGSGTAYADGANITVTEKNKGTLTLYAQWEKKWFEIGNAEQLCKFAQMVNSGKTGIKARLVDNIDMSTVCHAASEGVAQVNWTPIGNNDNRYAGTFDGDHHTISGLYHNNSAAYYVGLFGYTSGATIKNVGVVNALIKGKQYVGGVCGYNYKSCITNCYATGTVSGGNTVGGVCGINYDNSSITNCYATGDVSGDGVYIGGVCGFNEKYSSITNCYATGTVSGQDYVAGVCGRNNYNGSVTNCYTTKAKAMYSLYGDDTNVKGDVSTERFASGEIAYLLNGSIVNGTWTAGPTDGSQAWYQNLSENGDDSPRLSGKTVYYNAARTPAYYNVVEQGDLNGDGVITIADLTLLVEILNGRATDTNGTADVDGNGNITTEDANALKNMLLGK